KEARAPRLKAVSMHEHHQPVAPAAATAGQSTELTLPLKDLSCLCCAEELQKTTRSLPQVVAAKVDFAAAKLTVKYHAGMISEDAIRAAINASGRCTCAGDEMPPTRQMAHLNHRAQMAPVTMATRADRMQYEMPSMPAYADHEMEHGQAMAH